MAEAKHLNKDKKREILKQKKRNMSRNLARNLDGDGDRERLERKFAYLEFRFNAFCSISFRHRTFLISRDARSILKRDQNKKKEKLYPHYLD